VSIFVVLQVKHKKQLKRKIMAQIGSLASSANQTFNLDFLPQFIVIGDPVTDLTISNLSVVSGGQQLMSVTSAARLMALAKYQQGALLGANVKVPMGLSLSLGRVNKQTTINALNGAATTPGVFAASLVKSDIARTAVESSINASANGSFSGFEALFFNPVNVLRAQITFSNGFSDEFTVPELDALNARLSICDADGRLAGLTVINGEGVDRVTIFNSSGGNTVVLASGYVSF
jgi:hypothetical protein